MPTPRRKGRRRLRRRLSVAAIAALAAAAIAGIVAFALQTGPAPHIGDHWHANYQTIVCGNRQPNIRQFQGGVHTHSDGIIHIHPFTSSEEGRGARLVKFFEYAGGKLTSDTLRYAGDREWKNGDLCEGGQFDGQPGRVQVFVNGELLEDFGQYIPQDGDSVRITFGPPAPAEDPARPQEAARALAIDTTDRGNPAQDSFFAPSSLTMAAGETVRVTVKNSGTISHNMRVAGPDNEYDTSDDFTSQPEIITPGGEGTLLLRIDEPGRYVFRCDIHPNVHTGVLIVEPPGESSPEDEGP